MTPTAPQPGEPLNGESARLLMPGDPLTAEAKARLRDGDVVWHPYFGAHSYVRDPFCKIDEHWSFMARPTAQADKTAPEACPICAEPFVAGILCAIDADLGSCHAACLEGSPVVHLDTGEPYDGKVFTYRWESDARAAKAVAWRWRSDLWSGDGWRYTATRPDPKGYLGKVTVEPLYTAPSRMASDAPAEPAPTARGEAFPCNACRGSTRVWSAPNALWNKVVGSPEGFLCPNCFIDRAEALGFTPVWHLSDAPAEGVGEREKIGLALRQGKTGWMADCVLGSANVKEEAFRIGVDAIFAALQAAPAEASLESLKRSRDVANYRAHQLVRTLLEVKDSIETYPLDDTATCMCGSPVEGHNVGSGHAPVSQADHAISLIVGDINKALGLANTPDDALGTGRPDDYEGPDAGMHDTEVVDDDSDDLHEIEDAAK